MMIKKGLPAVLFPVTFIVTYLFLCFGLPGMRIKLDAEPIELFFRSIAHMVLFKSGISFVVAGFVAAIPLIICKKK